MLADGAVAKADESDILRNSDRRGQVWILDIEKAEGSAEKNGADKREEWLEINNW